MSQVFANGELRPVYYKIKTVDGKGQYQRAPFDVMVVNGCPYISPRSIGVPDAALGRLGVDGAEAKDTWREGDFCYETLEPIILEKHQMGDGSDNWVGLNAISDF